MHICVIRGRWINRWIGSCSIWLSGAQNFIRSIFLTHWGRVTHICVNKLTIIGSDNGLSPGRGQTIIWINDGVLLIWPLGTNFSEIFSKIHIFSLKKMHLKTSSAKWWPFCLGLNVLNLSHCIDGIVVFLTLKLSIVNMFKIHFRPCKCWYNCWELTWALILYIITHAPLFRGGADHVYESPLGDSCLVMNIHNPFMHCATSHDVFKPRDVIMLTRAVTIVAA